MSKELINDIKNGTIPVDFNWNSEYHYIIPSKPLYLPAEPTAEQIRRIRIVDEGLRDGLHGVPKYPEYTQIRRYAELTAQMGIDIMTVGIFNRDGSAGKSIRRLLREMRNDTGLQNITPIVLSLATEESLKWSAECKTLNPKLQTIVFMGTAPFRLMVEEWSRDHVIETLSKAVSEAVNIYGLEVIGATEHTTQTPPDFLKKIVEAQVENGANIFCIADTIGISRPVGTYRIVTFVKQILKDMRRENVLVDWHGHRDTGNDLGNALMAIASGADRVHVVPRGIGERSGNAQEEALLINLSRILQENGYSVPWRTTKLNELLEFYSNMVGLGRPSHGPLAERSHITSLGIHTAAMFKADMLAAEARGLGEPEIADRLDKMARTIYTAVDPEEFGMKHDIHVGPWSGASTVKLAFKIIMDGDPATLPSEKINSILETANKLGRELTEEELIKLLSSNGNSH